MSYEDSWRRFAAWCVRAELSALPASSETVALWATSMLVAGLKVTTVALRISGVVHWHRKAGYSSPSGPEVRKLLNGARRLRRETPRQKRALTVEQLRRVSRALDAQTAMGLRDRAVFVLGFAGAFRRSELSALDLADVSFVSKGLLIHLRGSKTDPLGRGRDVGIAAGDCAATCPVRTLRAWLDRRGARPGAMFVAIHTGDQITKRRIGPNGIVDIIKRGVERIGLDGHNYAGHSLRSGCITAAAENGASELAIMQRSGHKSVQMVHRYVRPVTAFSVNPLAALL